MEPQVRVFPHSKNQFPTADSLQTWLLTALRGRGGVYLLTNPNAIAGTGPGSVVLFRHGQIIVGDAVVGKSKENLAEPLTDTTLTGGVAEYLAQITFEPSSIRLYAPPLPVERIQLHVPNMDLVTFAPAYHTLEWATYGLVLQEVVAKGRFVH
jgi:hypothetical protein